MEDRECSAVRCGYLKALLQLLENEPFSTDPETESALVFKGFVHCLKNDRDLWNMVKPISKHSKHSISRRSPN